MAKKSAEKTNLSIEMGNRIKRARKERKIGSVVDLAKLLNYSRQTVSGWENGVPIANLETLKKLCEILDCDIGYLFGEYDSYHIEQAGISERTGLCETAISILLMKQKRAKSGLLGAIDNEKELEFLNEFIFSQDRLSHKIETLLRLRQYKKKLVRDPYFTYYYAAYTKRLKTITRESQLDWLGSANTDTEYLNIIKAMMEEKGIILDERKEKKMIANANRCWYYRQFNEEQLSFEIAYGFIKTVDDFIEKHINDKLNTFKDRK